MLQYCSLYNSDHSSLVNPQFSYHLTINYIGKMKATESSKNKNRIESK